MMMMMMSTVIWNVTPCSLVDFFPATRHHITEDVKDQ
jgi:hypothetical protein